MLAALLCQGCATSLALPDRVSYSSEKAFTDKMPTLEKIVISGNPANRQIFVSKAASSVCGSAHTSTFNVGEVFNLYLEQLSKASGTSCKTNCIIVEITIESVDIDYSLDCMRGKIDAGSFRATLVYRINNINGSTTNQKMTYAAKEEQINNEQNANFLFPITKSIENVVVQSMTDALKIGLPVK